MGTVNVADARTGEGVLVVLPTYNEAPTIQRVLEAVHIALPSAHMLVVDDASPDGTAALARQVGDRSGSVQVLARPAKSGLGSAYRDGFRWGLERGYRVLCEMDSDLSHDPGDLGRLVEPVLAGEAELVIGSRYVTGGETVDWSPARQAISRLGNLYANTLLRLGVADATAGFRAYAASLLLRLDLDQLRADSYGFQVEMTHLTRTAGGRVAEVPIRFVDRQAGVSKMSAHTVREAFVVVAALWVKGLVGRDRSAVATRPTAAQGRGAALEPRGHHPSTEVRDAPA